MPPGQVPYYLNSRSWNNPTSTGNDVVNNAMWNPDMSFTQILDTLGGGNNYGGINNIQSIGTQGSLYPGGIEQGNVFTNWNYDRPVSAPGDYFSQGGTMPNVQAQAQQGKVFNANTGFFDFPSNQGTPAVVDIGKTMNMDFINPDNIYKTPTNYVENPSGNSILDNSMVEPMPLVAGNFAGLGSSQATAGNLYDASTGTSYLDAINKINNTTITPEEKRQADFDFENQWTGQQIAGAAFGGLQALASLSNAYNARKSFKLAEDQFDFSKGLSTTNLANQAKTVNAQMADRQANRVASGGAVSVEDYMAKNGVSGRVA